MLPPLQATLTRLRLRPQARDRAGGDQLGPDHCLLDAPRTLKVTNDSLINAPFKTFIKNARSKYRVDIREGVLMPQETVDLTITANLDDTTMHRDQMHMIVAEGDNLIVPWLPRAWARPCSATRT